LLSTPSLELLLLLRDCLVRESGDKLIVGSGVPTDWLAHDFSVVGLPTHFGLADLSYNAKRGRVRVVTERPITSVVSEFPGAVEVTVGLSGSSTELEMA